jgi:hypothetical protein
MTKVVLRAAVTVAAVARLLQAPEATVAQCCGDCNADGTVTIDETITVANRTLSGCRDDGICAQTGGQRFPATGQTISFTAGDDGSVKAGAPLRYADNADGTITDLNTGLTWEKKIKSDGMGDAANLNDADNCYPWAGSCAIGDALCGTNVDCGANGPCVAADCQVSSPDGQTIFQWVAALNAANFAGHNDWRVPNVKELQSIVNYGSINPAVSTAFDGASCHASCPDLTDPACSCTQSFNYWSSATVATIPTYAWSVFFGNGGVFLDSKGNDFNMRAVRGGL